MDSKGHLIIMPRGRITQPRLLEALARREQLRKLSAALHREAAELRHLLAAGVSPEDGIITCELVTHEKGGQEIREVWVNGLPLEG